MAMHPYVFFSNNCREAFTRYHEIFGGDLVLLPKSDAPPDQRLTPDQGELIMHAALTFGDNLLMGSDDPTGDGGPKTGMSINYDAPDPAEAQRVFDAVADGGSVTMPMEKTFWSPLFGMCVDRFGTPWMISAGAPRDEPSS